MLAEAKSKRDALAKHREKIVGQIATFRTLLTTRTAQQRQVYTNRGAPTATQVQAVVKVHAGNAAAQKAVDFALAQVGRPYVFAACGPTRSTVPA